MNAPKWDCVATYHENPWTCGVTRWNQRLAQELGVPMVPILSSEFLKYDRPLPSVKRSECDIDVYAWERIGQREFLEHDEQGIRRWHPYREGYEWLWCPETVPVYPRQLVERGVVSVLCFGMMHKLQPERFRQLAALIRKDLRVFSVYVSTAIHEGTALDAQFTKAYEDISAIFNGRTQFLGWLADAAIGTVLSQSHLFAAFFPSGVRANNTTVMSALAAGCPVITNLDARSPEWLIHGQTVLDINQCDTLPESVYLEDIGWRGQTIAQARYSWAKLIEVLCA